MTDKPKLEVITTDRRKGGTMPQHRAPMRAEDMDAFKGLVDQACAAVETCGQAAETLAKKLAQG